VTNGTKMTRLISTAIKTLGTRCGDITEGSPSALAYYSEHVYQKHPELKPLARVYDSNVGYSDDWPTITAITLEEVETIAAGLGALNDEEQACLQEEFEALKEATSAAISEVRNVLTVCE